VKKKTRRELAREIIARLREGLNRPQMSEQELGKANPRPAIAPVKTARVSRSPRPAEA
jgi:hypothetical protein